jgi:hypothetical protein
LVDGHLFLPIRCHLFSPVAAIFSLHHIGCRWGSDQGLRPLASGSLREPAAALAFGDAGRLLFSVRCRSLVAVERGRVFVDEL